MNIPTKALEHLLNIEAPVKKIELQGRCKGIIKDHFPLQKGNIFSTGDIVVMEEHTKSIRVFEKLYKSTFSDRYIAFYMTYEDCVEYGVILTDSPVVAHFNFEYKTRLHAAVTTEDYVSLLQWVYKETFGKQNIYKTYEKYEEIARYKRESLVIHSKKVNPIEEYCIHRILVNSEPTKETANCM